MSKGMEGPPIENIQSESEPERIFKALQKKNADDQASETVSSANGAEDAHSESEPERIFKALQKEHADTQVPEPVSGASGVEDTQTESEPERIFKALQKESVSEPAPKERTSEQPEAQRPKPHWRSFVEPSPKNGAERALLAERKQYLTNVFGVTRNKNFKESFSRVVWNNLGQLMAEPGRVNERLQKRIGEETLQKKIEHFLRAYNAQDISLADLVDSAKSFDDIRALKLMSLAFLPVKGENNQATWAALPEQRRRQARVGELIGLEAERKQIELQMARTSRDTPLDKNLIQRACERYMKYSQSPDIPDAFRQRFASTAERWAKANNVLLPERKKPVSQFRTGSEVTLPSRAEQQIGQSKERVAAIGEAYKKAQPTFDMEQLKILKQELMETSPLVREMEQNIYEERFQYPDSFLQALKDRPPMSAQPENEVYRKNFIDSMYLQIRHSQFINSNPPWFYRVARGVIEKFDARIQVVGFWNAAFRWKWTREKMQQAREDTISSLQNIAGVGFDPDMAAYHAAEFAMANLNERKSTGEWAEGAEEISTATEESPRSAQEQSRVRVDENSEGYKNADEALRQYYNQQLATPNSPAPLAVSSSEGVREDLFDRIRSWREAHQDVENLKDFQVQAPSLWFEMESVAKRLKMTPAAYWARVRGEVNKRRVNEEMRRGREDSERRIRESQQPPVTPA